VTKPKKRKQRRKQQKKQKHECVCCKELTGTLALEDGTFICEDCAQAMSDLAP
jgi:ribosomal protein L37AE/L43A